MIATTGPTPFRLDDAYRDKLDQYASKQYSAQLVDNYERATELRDRLHGGNAIGAGAGRLVYEVPGDSFEGGAYDRYVLKLAVPNDSTVGSDGREQNRREANLWERTENRYLTPVVAADPEGYWLVMPHGESLSEADNGFEGWKDGVRQSLGDEIARKDITRGNTVRLDGSCRLCDYGVGPA